ncbi:hypothetical protein SCH01S_32_00310 [Sphingomonas changbaiensis NBRC 104936]|uniref:Uncharacterized protein n=1 Tax=Sphingomonas changbaiensis NBRC 104936 TaxID=1219043 RepID=A0A0E9MPL9_9SPHN|nr:hypothetical protein [Sphingomonas changbaiensis]GAO39494.1 hypothetical protein SCH01S_32_00310 [Sphingomonas changbaiensis NBRC 104936]
MTKRKKLIGSADRVLGASTKKDCAIHIVPVMRIWFGQARMHDRDGFEGYACFRKLKNDAAASAIAESEELVGVNIRCREQSIQRYATNGPHPLSVGQQWHGSGQHCFRPTEEGLSAMKVHRERDITVRGEIISTAPLIVVKTNAVVSNENRGPRAFADWPC